MLPKRRRQASQINGQHQQLQSSTHSRSVRFDRSFTQEGAIERTTQWAKPITFAVVDFLLAAVPSSSTFILQSMQREQNQLGS